MKLSLQNHNPFSSAPALDIPALSSNFSFDLFSIFLQKKQPIILRFYDISALFKMMLKVDDISTNLVLLLLGPGRIPPVKHVLESQVVDHLASTVQHCQKGSAVHTRCVGTGQHAQTFGAAVLVIISFIVLLFRLVW